MLPLERASGSAAVSALVMAAPRTTGVTARRRTAENFMLCVEGRVNQWEMAVWMEPEDAG